MPMWPVVSSRGSEVVTRICRMKGRRRFVFFWQSWRKKKKTAPPRRGRSVDQVGLAKRFKIRILMGQFFQIVIQFDGSPHVGLGGGEVAPLGRVTA